MRVLEEGAIFAGRYRIVRRLAAGGMGEVYEVVHLETERRRALKVMLPHILHSPALRERFQREARLGAHIESEFIVDVFDAGVDETTAMPFLVMELLRGEELGERLERVGKLSPEEVVTSLAQAALALDRTHKASVVHRDLKPGNLFLTERDDGVPHLKVLDFGIAKVLAEGMTGAGVTNGVGTPLYMAPEQFAAESRISPAADIYALGMIAYTCLVGAPYWATEMESGWSVFAFGNVAAKGPRELARVRAWARGVVLPPAFDRWFMKATAVHPADRFATASIAIAALAEALEVPLPRAGAASSPESAPARSVRAWRAMPTPLNAGVTRTLSRRATSSAVAMVVLVAVAVIAFLLVRAPRAVPAVDVASAAPKDSAPPAATGAPSAAAPSVSAMPLLSASTMPVPTSTPSPPAARTPAPTKAPKKYTRD